MLDRSLWRNLIRSPCFWDFSGHPDWTWLFVMGGGDSSVYIQGWAVTMFSRCITIFKRKHISWVKQKKYFYTIDKLPFGVSHFFWIKVPEELFNMKTSLCYLFYCHFGVFYKNFPKIFAIYINESVMPRKKQLRHYGGIVH